MSSQMQQLFKVLLAFVMVMLIGSYISSYLETNYSAFDMEETGDTTGE